MHMRGLIPSLGAGGSLIAAALCAVALFGGTLAFRGEAGGTAEANAGAVTLPSRTVRAQTSSSGLVETVLTLATVGRRPAPTDRPARPRPRRRETTVTPRRETAPPATITPRTPAPAATAAPTPPPPAETTPPTAPDPVTGTVQRAVAQVHAVADPVIQHVPDPVGQHAESLTQTVDQVAQTVDETVTGLLP